MISDRASREVLRSIAVFEAVKGLIVLLAGFGLLSLLHRDLHALAIALVGKLHLNPGHHYPSVFIAAATRLTDSDLWMAALFGVGYSSFRFLEAYGLWYERTWAEWLAIASGTIYLPVEVYELAAKFTWVRVTALVANLAVVVAMALLLWRKRRQAELHRVAKERDAKEASDRM